MYTTNNFVIHSFYHASWVNYFIYDKIILVVQMNCQGWVGKDICKDQGTVVVNEIHPVRYRESLKYLPNWIAVHGYYICRFSKLQCI